FDYFRSSLLPPRSKRMPNVRRMAPTTAVWNSKISLKRQGFSSTQCTKLSLTPTRMTTTPGGTDSTSEFVPRQGQSGFIHSILCDAQGEQCREHPAASQNTPIPCCKAATLKAAESCQA